MENVKSGGQADHIPQDIGHATQSRALKAVLGDGIVNLLHGEVGELKLVAIGVDEFAEVGLGRLIVGGK